MTMSSAERRAAQVLLGEAPPGEADPEVDRLVREMRATAGALRAWRDRHARPARRRSLARSLIAVAAALVAAIGLWFFLRPGPPPPPPAVAPEELAWTAPAPPGKGKPGMPDGVPGGGIGERLGGPPGAPRGSGDPGAHPPGLPGGFRLARTLRVSEDRRRLELVAGNRTLTVFLARSAGPDTGFGRITVAGRPLVARRHAGVLVAFDPSALEEKHWEPLASRLEGELK